MNRTISGRRKRHLEDFKKCVDSASLDIINSNLSEILLKQGKGWGSSTTKEEVLAILDLATVSFKDELTIFDIGASVGLYTEALLEQFPNARIFAFEPSKKAFLSLSRFSITESKD
jgi:phospholipid N-methyltransferase